MNQILNNNEIQKNLAEIRQKIEKLDMPRAAYAGIASENGQYCISIIDGGNTIMSECTEDTDHLTSWLKKYSEKSHIKIIAAGLADPSLHRKLCSGLWLASDIVPIHIPSNEKTPVDRAEYAARQAALHFDPNNLIKVIPGTNNEVTPTRLVTLKDYQQTVPALDWQKLLGLTQDFQEKKHRILFFNATPQGGGVALMRHALLRLLKLLDIDAHWHVMTARRDIFEITKTKFHNILQDVAPEDVYLSEEDKKEWSNWSKENAIAFKDNIKNATIIVIDDPQPSGMIPHIKNINPSAKIIYRSHIHLESKLAAEPGTPQYNTWQFLWQNIKDHDIFVSHPVPDFLPQNIAPQKTVTMPPATDPLDGLNKELSESQKNYYLSWFDKILLEHHQEPLDRTRPFIAQIARFDPSKGITDVLESYKLLREKLSKKPDVAMPQLVIAGHSSIDDPDGIPIYSLTMNLLQQDAYKDIASDIKVARLPHSDQILNALLRCSKVVLQLSHKEGFEVKVTEAISKGRPVIAYRSGGIVLQIENGQTGWLIKTGQTSEVADRLYDLFADQELYDRVSRKALNYPNNHYYTVRNAINWLHIVKRLSEPQKTYNDIEELMPQQST